jgi:hypothetical protein
MRIWAYCTAPAARSVAEATGVTPVTSPPATASNITSAALEGHDLLYFRLHGMNADVAAWFGESETGSIVPALEPCHVRGADLGGAAVVVANCFGFETLHRWPFYQSGASAVIAGPGPNYAARNRVVGADKLVRGLIAGLREGQTVERALAIARRALLFTCWRATDRDARQFEILTRS